LILKLIRARHAYKLLSSPLKQKTDVTVRSGCQKHPNPTANIQSTALSALHVSIGEGKARAKRSGSNSNDDDDQLCQITDSPKPSALSLLHGRSTKSNDRKQTKDTFSRIGMRSWPNSAWPCETGRQIPHSQCQTIRRRKAKAKPSK
jgi:hypothetical protein